MMALTDIIGSRSSALLCLVFISVSGTHAADLPHFRAGNGAEWAVSARLNGDQSNQGRQLTMDPRKIRIYRVRLYSASQ